MDFLFDIQLKQFGLGLPVYTLITAINDILYT